MIFYIYDIYLWKREAFENKDELTKIIYLVVPSVNL